MAVAFELSDPTITAEPGQTATCDITVRNDGLASESVRLAVAGLPGPWGWITPSDLTVPPNGEAGARLCFQPPRSSNVAAGRFFYSVTATANANAVTVEGSLDVAPFAEISTRLEPRIAYGRSGTFTAIVENAGNAAASVAVTVEAPDDVRVTVEPSTVGVPAAGEAQVCVEVRSRRRAVWREHSQTLSVTAAATGAGAVAKGSGAHAPGMLLDRPRRVRVALGAVVALVAAAIGVAVVAGGGDGFPTNPR